VIGSLPDWAKNSAPGINFTLHLAGETENAREFSGMDFAELTCGATEGRMKIHPGLSSAIAASATTRVPPAHAAREALAANPDLAGLPFGKLVSAIARGLPLPSASTSEPAAAAEHSPAAISTMPEPDPSQAP
jgi:hypothetical protein